MFALLILAAAPLFALADEIAAVQANNSSIGIEMMGSKPSLSTYRFTSGGDSYFVVSLNHSVLLGGARLVRALPNQSGTVTAAQYSDSPHVVHLVVRTPARRTFRVSVHPQAGTRYRITLAFKPPVHAKP